MNRVATHAGSWYTDSNARLNAELDKYLGNVSSSTEEGESYPIKGARAIIAPHAGYSYSGPTAAYAYKCIDVSEIERVFILGPSHHVYLDGCALSKCDTYNTPIGNLTLDKATIQELYETGKFQWMNKDVDEDEHSIEMHLPYTAKIFSSKLDRIKVVPIMVGAIDDSKEKLFGELLSGYLADPKTLFIVSSDFCHWGLRFSYTYYQPNDREGLVRLGPSDSVTNPPIHESISNMDHEGMRHIESLDHTAFSQYLRTTKNTICGRHPIGVLLCALAALQNKQPRIQFTKYAQSNPCQRVRDSSVSYASAYVYID
ncbi:MEMO1 protein [Zychaea mexicana]|uniref:MEMO1 protein n=1 Tax=Zychaea mexicana TaxID=64656 RepID=UPI0022FF1DF7|nr:MEMO1 protein [Zychaea mexicana]KAI9482589.1 MEMO1 protein [Zychaea mexicana]